MATTLVVDDVLNSNASITSKDTYEHVHLGHYTMPAAGRYRVLACLRGQIRQSLTTGALTDYIALVAALFVDGTMVDGTEVLVANSRTDPVNVMVATATPVWEVEWDGDGTGELDIRFKAVYAPSTRNNANDVVFVATDGNGRCWFRVEAL